MKRLILFLVMAVAMIAANGQDVKPASNFNYLYSPSFYRWETDTTIWIFAQGKWVKLVTNIRMKHMVDSIMAVIGSTYVSSGSLGAKADTATVWAHVRNVSTAHNINLKVDKVAGKGLSTNDYTTDEKSKLAGIEAGANNYTHPANHAPSIITQDASNRFVSDAEKATWNAKQPAGSYEPANSNIQSHIASISNPHSVTKAQVGLPYVDNTPDADKPISTATQTELNKKINSTEKGSNLGVATLDGGGKVPMTQLPSSLMIYLGLWNPITNTPALADGNGVNGWVYKADTTGTINLGSGARTWNKDDYAIYNGEIWEHSSATDKVLSVNSQTGAVILNSDNISEGSTNKYYTDTRAALKLAVADSSATLDGKYATGKMLKNGLALKQNTLTNPVTGTGSSGQVAFWSGTGTQTGDAGLVWDNTNKAFTVAQTVVKAINGNSPLFQLYTPYGIYVPHLFEIKNNTSVNAYMTKDGVLQFAAVQSPVHRITTNNLGDGSNNYINSHSVLGGMDFYTNGVLRVAMPYNGNVGIGGVTTPTSLLHLAAGTATASTAPLKFTSGVNLTTPEAGAIEWDGTNLYATQTSGPTRKTLAYLEAPIFTSLAVSNLTASQIVETDASKNLISAAKGTAYNKNFGTEAGTVSEGNHNHTGVYQPVGSYATSTDLTNHANSTTTAHGLGASAFHADSYFALSGHDQAWSTITNTPTTLSGYGITDAAPSYGSANYIQNQANSAQSANMWINGNINGGFYANNYIGFDYNGNGDYRTGISLNSGTRSLNFINIMADGNEGFRFISGTKSSNSQIASISPTGVINDGFGGNSTLWNSAYTGLNAAGLTTNYLPKWDGSKNVNSGFYDYGNSGTYIPTSFESPVLGTFGSGFKVTYPNGLYGIGFHVNPDGFSTIQAMRFDGNATAYDLQLQPLGGSVFVGYTSDPTSGNRFAVNGNAYVGGTGIFRSSGGDVNTPITALIIDNEYSSTTMAGGGTAIELRGKSSGGNISNYGQARIRSVGYDFNNAHGLAFDVVGSAGTGYIEALKLESNKDATFGGSVTATGGGFNSSRKLKDIYPDWKGSALKAINDFKLRDFSYKTDSGKNRTLGFIIDEIPKTIQKYAIRTGGEAVNTYTLHGLSFKAHQEESERIEKLESMVSFLTTDKMETFKSKKQQRLYKKLVKSMAR